MGNGTTAVEVSVPEATGAPGQDWFQELLARVEEPESLRARRQEAWERYRELPMPTKKSEEWRYTDLSRLEPGAFRPADPATAEREDVGYENLPEAVRAVLERSEERAGLSVSRNGTRVHGWLDAELAEAGVIFAPLAEVAERHPKLLERWLYRTEVAPHEEKLWSLRAAALTDGYLLYVPRGVRVDRPVHVFRYVDEAGILVAAHSLVVAEAESEITCIDEYLSPDLGSEALSLSGMEIFGGDAATVRYVSLQRYGRGVKHFAAQHVRAGRDTRVEGFNVALGADLARADVSSRLAGPGSESEMLALWFGDREQHIDHHTLQHHAAPHAHSDLLYKGALTDSARSVFRGLIRVDRGAQLTDAYQTNRNLLLSETSNATSLPNLEIEADDVRCSHGATIGQVDEAQVFYLMSRGLTLRQAERLLVFGFFDEVLNRLPLEGVRARVREAIEQKIGIR